MWYFSWILGLGLACAFAILNAMWLELDDASQTVRLWLGWVDDGSRNGNMLKPAMVATPATERLLARNAILPAAKAKANAATSAPVYASAGAAIIQG